MLAIRKVIFRFTDQIAHRRPPSRAKSKPDVSKMQGQPYIQTNGQIVNPAAKVFLTKMPPELSFLF